MCGVVFMYRPDFMPDQFDRPLGRAMACLAHRGPDGGGRMIQAPWAIGHRRLAVIDPNGSPQPMTDPHRRFFLSYNGELYNYAALRAELSRHWSFRTQGDVEVVLAGLVVHGASFLERMEGQWALALWDSLDNRLMLVRDRMGKKPLFFQTDRQRLVCASELGALVHLSWGDWLEDADSTADYLRYGYYLPGTTAYRQVQEVLPGHCLYWRPGQCSSQQAYWRLKIGGFTGRREQACEMVRHCVTEAVARRLVADVEVGALLSGGVDSSLVVAIATGRLRHPLKTFTLGFDDVGFDERFYAKAIARRFATQHFQECSAVGQDGMGMADQVLIRCGQPFADVSLMPTEAVCHLASRHVKVVLSGDGGDELFSGYQRYLGRSLLRWFTRLPHGLQCKTEQVITAFREPMAHHSTSLAKKAYLLMEMVKRLPSETPYVAPCWYPAEELARLAPDLNLLGHRAPRLPEMTDADDLHRMMTADALVYLPQDILAKVDRAGMAHGLEVRSPLLDRRVVELAFALPRTWHRWGWNGKRMLRDAFSDVLPAWVWRRRKHGFGAPVHRWFCNGRLALGLIALLHSVDHPLHSIVVERMIQEHHGGYRDHGHRLWQILIYLRWLEQKPWRTC